MKKTSLLVRGSALTLALFSAMPAMAQDDTVPADEAAEAAAEGTIVVTGSRIRRPNLESTVPITSITGESFFQQGQTNIGDTLNDLPQLRSTFAQQNPGLGIGIAGLNLLDLRGLGTQRTLVLVNGRRHVPADILNNAVSPDINTIPNDLIERVDIVTGGNSAIYGSDAIAGVINIVLKGSGQGGSLNARYGQYSAGDGEQYQVSGDAGVKLGEAGFIHFAAQGGEQDQTDRARPARASATAEPTGLVVQRQGDPEVDNHSFSYNAELPAGDALSFYSYGLYTKRDVLSNGFFRGPADARNIPEIYPQGFLPQIHNKSEDYGFVGGLRASTEGGTNIDISYTYGSNELTFDIENTLNRSLGPASPTEFYAGALEVRQHVLNFDFNKALEWGLAYPVTLSYGAEWRGDEFEQSAGEPGSYALGPFANLPGAQVFPGFKPTDGGEFDRHAFSYYAGLEADLTEKLSLGLAARYEDYSDFGDTLTGKLSGRFAFTDKVALRATASTGFHAPSLQQQYYQSTSTNFIQTSAGNLPFDIVTFRVNNPAAIALGAEPLEAEESTNYSLGLVLQPLDSLYITIDAYQIELDDRITLSENLTTAPVRNYLNANGFPGVGGGRYFTNAIDTTTTGVDLVGTYSWNLASGTLALTSGYNYNDTEIDKIAANPAALEAIDPAATRVGRSEIGRITKGSPRDKFFLSGDWKVGNFGVVATATRYGEFTVFSNSPATAATNDQTFGSEWTLDVAFKYSLEQWEFTLGGDNVFDSYPDEVLFVNSTSGQLPYSGSSPFGFNGAYLYANVNYKW